MSFVLDASTTLTWCFPDETSVETKKLLDKVLEGQLVWVPALWSLEITNVLLMAEKRRRIGYEELIKFLGLLQTLSLQVDITPVDKSFHEILTLAHAEKLTTYDASYLELAMRKSLPLASKDKALCVAAKKLGIKTL